MRFDSRMWNRNMDLIGYIIRKFDKSQNKQEKVSLFFSRTILVLYNPEYSTPCPSSTPPASKATSTLHLCAQAVPHPT